MNEIQLFLTNIAAILASIGTVIAFSGKIKTWLLKDLKISVEKGWKHIDDNTKSLEQIKEENKKQTKALQSVLRGRIVAVYQEYKKEKILPLTTYEAVVDYYDQYHNLGGNGAISRIIDEIESWEKI